MNARRRLGVLLVVLGLGSAGSTSWSATPASATGRSAVLAASSAPRCSTSLPAGTVVGMATTDDGLGYWIASSTGQVAACGDAPAFGNGPSGVSAIAAAPTGNGYWLATGSGVVEAFGSAVYHGQVSGNTLSKPIVAVAADPATGGYWLLGGDGGVFSFQAPFYGSTGNIRLNKPAVGLEATQSGKGYRFVASDGGIFDYGDAKFYGSMGSKPLSKPVVGMAEDPATGGYWLDASDGGIFSFRAPFHGSTGNIALQQPCVGMAAMPDGSGYRFVAADGGIFDFNAPFEGSAVAPPPPGPASCSVTLSNYNPPQYSDITASIQSNVPNTSVTMSKAYKTTTSYDYSTTDSAGSTSITFYDSGATIGYKVVVTVTIGAATCQTSFTPS